MIYFRTKWGAKEPQNPQKHRVVRRRLNIPTFSTGVHRFLQVVRRISAINSMKALNETMVLSGNSPWNSLNWGLEISNLPRHLGYPPSILERVCFHFLQWRKHTPCEEKDDWRAIWGALGGHAAHLRHISELIVSWYGKVKVWKPGWFSWCFFVGFQADHDYNTQRIHTMVYSHPVNHKNQANAGNIAYMDL